MPWILHGYNGNIQLTKQLEKPGILFSFGLNIFDLKAKVIESFRHLPLEKIFFETDEMEDDVEVIYKQGAYLKEVSIDILKNAAWDNFNQIENRLLSRF